MIGIGAIVKSIARSLEAAGTAAILGLRLTLGARRPQPCPIVSPVEAKRHWR